MSETDWLSDSEMFTRWQQYLSANPPSFIVPGHKRRVAHLHPDLVRLYDADAPLYGGVDTAKLEDGVLDRAQQRAAELWGVDWCRFSTGGSTHSNQAVVLALGTPGDKVLVTRTAHRSTLTGLVLAGLDPVWLPTDIDERFGIPAGLSITALEQALEQHPDAVAVLAVEPSYMGTYGDVAAMADAAHRHDMPLIVDQAWGAHLGFTAAYPRHALDLGADAIIISTHKTLPALSQASVVLAKLDRLDADRLERGFDATYSTSTNGPIQVSTDVSRGLLASDFGRRLLDETVTRVAALRTRLREVGAVVPGPEDFAAGRFDPAKFVVLLGPTGHSGLSVEKALEAKKIGLEMADRDTIVPIITVCDDDESVRALADGMVEVLRSPAPDGPRPIGTATQWGSFSPRAMIPREAFFARHTTVPFAESLGRVSAEIIAPYPPGVPVLVPGEVVTEKAVERLLAAGTAGLRIAYAADPTLATIQVVA